MTNFRKFSILEGPNRDYKSRFNGFRLSSFSCTRIPQTAETVSLPLLKNRAFLHRWGYGRQTEIGYPCRKPKPLDSVRAVLRSKHAQNMEKITFSGSINISFINTVQRNRKWLPVGDVTGDMNPAACGQTGKPKGGNDKYPRIESSGFRREKPNEQAVSAGLIDRVMRQQNRSVNKGECASKIGINY